MAVKTLFEAGRTHERAKTGGFTFGFTPHADGAGIYVHQVDDFEPSVRVHLSDEEAQALLDLLVSHVLNKRV